jgi:hypothetical protein
MDGRRVVVAVTAIFIFALAWNGLVHLVLLREADLALLPVGRPPQERNLLLGLAVTAGLALLFVVSFLRCGGKGIRAGIRHGAFFGLLAGLLVDVNQYLLYPLPGTLALQWFAFGFVEFCIYGVIAGVTFRRGG